MTEFQNSGNFVVLNSFQPMQVENPNFELFWGACPKNLLNGLGLMKELLAWKSQGISYCLESDNPVSARKSYSFLFLKLSSVLGQNDS